jgi:hypothetical protein
VPPDPEAALRGVDPLDALDALRPLEPRLVLALLESRALFPLPPVVLRALLLLALR